MRQINLDTDEASSLRFSCGGSESKWLNSTVPA